MPRGQTIADRAANAMSRGQVVYLDADNLRLAAITSARFKLDMADAINWQTTQLRQAQLFTQDGDLMPMPQVRYRAKLAA